MSDQSTYTVQFKPTGNTIMLTGLSINNEEMIKIKKNTFPDDYSGSPTLVEIMKPFQKLSQGGGKRRKKKN